MHTMEFWDQVSFQEKFWKSTFSTKYIKTYSNIDSAHTEGYSKIQCEYKNNKLYVPLCIQVNDSLVV